jgi:hypothetical protein
MDYCDLPENIQYKINKIRFSDEVLIYMKNKDWWWHTVKSRSNIENKGYLDGEIHGGQDFF